MKDHHDQLKQMIAKGDMTADEVLQAFRLTFEQDSDPESELLNKLGLKIIDDLEKEGVAAEAIPDEFAKRFEEYSRRAAEILFKLMPEQFEKPQ